MDTASLLQPSDFSPATTSHLVRLLCSLSRGFQGGKKWLFTAFSSGTGEGIALFKEHGFTSGSGALVGLF